VASGSERGVGRVDVAAVDDGDDVGAGDATEVGAQLGDGTLRVVTPAEVVVEAAGVEEHTTLGHERGSEVDAGDDIVGEHEEVGELDHRFLHSDLIRAEVLRVISEKLLPLG